MFERRRCIAQVQQDLYNGSVGSMTMEHERVREALVCDGEDYVGDRGQTGLHGHPDSTWRGRVRVVKAVAHRRAWPASRQATLHIQVHRHLHLEVRERASSRIRHVTGSRHYSDRARL